MMRRRHLYENVSLWRRGVCWATPGSGNRITSGIGRWPAHAPTPEGGNSNGLYGDIDEETYNMQPIAKFDVLVIGAGIMGASCAYHLAEKGINVAVLEAQNAPAMGST